jgi:histidinol-phosphatase (PHP family)
MLYKTNYHTHTTFCDGKNSPEEYITKAIEMDMKILGFSAHSMLSFNTSWHLPVNRHVEYVKEIQRLKEVYKDKLEILCGFEADYFPPVAMPDTCGFKEFSPDYIIGSVHFVTGDNLDDGCFTVDGPVEEIENGIKTVFKGNEKKAVQTYFATERAMLESGASFDVMGHPDIIRKQNGKMHFFDENDGWYKRELIATANAIKKWGGIVEINTGGMSRAGVPSPYPSPFFLALLRERNVPVMINTDCHKTEGLCADMDKGLEEAKTAGYTELWYLSDGSWKSYSI